MNPCNNTPEADRPFDTEAALARAGVSERLLRQCEARGLIEGADAAAPRYTSEHISVLRFVRRASALGFGMNEIATLLALWRNEHRTSAEVRHVALSQAEALASRIEELQATKRVLERLANLCRGDHQPACPILDELVELNGFASQWHGEAKPPRVTASAAGCRCAPASR
ncbi:MerR family DNA-binding protein [Variovorax sp. LT1R20]|uniref:MerR family DNA-binding protein n=1 Tax=Variovorax sp. LT1R20 TaxID=3443729 RepID=UPI003F446EAE